MEVMPCHRHAWGQRVPWISCWTVLDPPPTSWCKCLTLGDLVRSKVVALSASRCHPTCANSGRALRLQSAQNSQPRNIAGTVQHTCLGGIFVQFPCYSMEDEKITNRFLVKRGIEKSNLLCWDTPCRCVCWSSSCLRQSINLGLPSAWACLLHVLRLLLCFSSYVCSSRWGTNMNNYSRVAWISKLVIGEIPPINRLKIIVTKRIQDWCARVVFILLSFFFLCKALSFAQVFALHRPHPPPPPSHS